MKDKLLLEYFKKMEDNMKEKLLLEYFKKCASAAINNVMIIGEGVPLKEWYERTLEYVHENLHHELCLVTFKLQIALPLVYLSIVKTDTNGKYITGTNNGRK